MVFLLRLPLLLGLFFAAVSGFQINRPQVQRFHGAVQVASLPKTARCSTRLFRASYDDDNDQGDKTAAFKSNPLVRETSRSLKTVSFFSWWAQVILTTISTVILLFARNVGGRAAAGAMGAPPPFFLSGTGVLVSVASIIWTWGNGARLSRRLVRRPTGKFQAANLLRRAVRVGVSLNLLGLFVNLVAAEQIVGNLAIKVLSAGSFGTQSAILSTIQGSLQPLDILVVQANTNSLLSHFCSLISLLFLTDKIRALDPPSGDDSERKR
jgi:hypothetical protein